MAIFGIGVSALAAAQAGLLTTQHNIANANTTGYHRQEVRQGTATPQFNGGGYFGQGVKVETVARIYSQYLDHQVQSAQAQASQHGAELAQLNQINNLLADPDAGLSTALQAFYAAAQDAATQPASQPSRQALLGAAESLAARFGALGGRLSELREATNAQVRASVAGINGTATQLADLNRQITLAESAGQPPNDLYDQRDQLLTDLNQQVRATTVRQADGSLNVFIGNGQPLVVGQQAYALEAKPSAADPGTLDIYYRAGETSLPLAAQSLTGGELGGLLNFRTQGLDAAQNALGRVALGLAAAFNAQHRLGQDLTGVAGGDFFAPLAPGAAVANAHNTGNAQLGLALGDAAQLTASDYQLAFDGANYTLTRLSDQTQTVFASLPQSVDGLDLSLNSGTPAAGDRFLLRPTRDAAGQFGMAITDPARFAAAAPVRAAAGAANLGTGKVSAGTVSAQDPNLLAPVSITFNNPPTTFNVAGTGTGNPSNVAYTPGAALDYNGWTVEISGAPAAGDTFTVAANAGGTADNRNALALAALQTQHTLAGGTTTFQGAYSQLVAQVGNRTREVETAARAQEGLLAQATQARESVSGVNLDEEAARLLRYQQAYQAAAQAIATASDVFQTLLGLGR